MPKTGLLAGRTHQGRPDLRRRGRRPGGAGQSGRDQGRAARRRHLCAQQEHGRPRRLRAVLRAVELHQGQARPDRLHADDAADSVRRRRPACRSRRWTIRSRAAWCSRLAARSGCSPAPAARSNSSTRTRATRRFTSIRSTSSASCRARMAVTIGYIGATGRDIGYFGTTAATPAKRSTSTRSIRRSRARRFRGRTAPGTRRRCARRCPTRSSASPGRASSARSRDDSGGPAAASVPAVRRRLQVSRRPTGGRRQYHAATFVLDKRATGRWGGRFSYTLEPDEGQPVRAGQHLPDAYRDAAEQLRPGCRIRHQQLRLAAPDHPGADRQVPGLEQQQRRRPAAARRVERISRRRAGQRLAAQRGAQHRRVRREPGALRRPAAAEPHRRSEHDRAATTIAWRRTTTPTRVYFNSAALREPGGGAIRQRAANQSATRGISSGRTSTSCWRRTRRSRGTHIGRDPLRDPQPHEHGEVQRASTRTRSTRRASAASRSRPGSCGSGSWRSGIASRAAAGVERSSCVRAREGYQGFSLRTVRAQRSCSRGPVQIVSVCLGLVKRALS